MTIALVHSVPVEADMVSAAGVLNRRAMLDLAHHRAAREYVAYGWNAPPMRTLVIEELRRLRGTAAVMVVCRQQRAALDALPAKERLVRTIELRLEVLRSGLAQPRDEHALAHYESLLAEVQAAAPDDPAVLLADMLSSE